MRIRPKPPSLVSMWMLDVFCCALGCVTLLWLLNTREARDNAKRAGSAIELLQETQSELADQKQLLIATKAEFDETQRRLNSNIQDLRGQLLAMTDERDVTLKQLALVRNDLESTETKLTFAVNKSDELSTKLKAVTLSADELNRLLRKREEERDALVLNAKKAEEQLSELDAKLQTAARETKNAQANLLAMSKTGDELAKSRETIRDLRQQLDDSNAQLVDLQGNKAKLADKINKLRIESESRFAGITMTGKRVVFAIDASGSMKLSALQVEAPQKWGIVVDTVGKVMRTLPNLEQYQVVVFSRKANYLFGTGVWQDYKGEESVNRVTDALKQVDPSGDTNMYEALDLAFALKPRGLDTIYLFSDGLPTSGPSLTTEELRTMTESERSAKLIRNIRETLETVWNPRRDPQRVTINAIGFFFESPEVGAFLWALAREHDGSFVGMSRP